MKLTILEEAIKKYVIGENKAARKCRIIDIAINFETTPDEVRRHLKNIRQEREERQRAFESMFKPFMEKTSIFD